MSTSRRGWTIFVENSSNKYRFRVLRMVLRPTPIRGLRAHMQDNFESSVLIFESIDNN